MGITGADAVGTDAIGIGASIGTNNGSATGQLSLQVLQQALHSLGIRTRSPQQLLEGHSTLVVPPRQPEAPHRNEDLAPVGTSPPKKQRTEEA